MTMRGHNILLEKSNAFTDRIVKLVIYLKQKGANKNYINQIDRSGSSIGANIAEGIFAQSRADFVSKLSIALKESNETKYWLEKLKTEGSLNDIGFNSLAKDLNDIIYILVATINTTKKNGV